MISAEYRRIMNVRAVRIVLILILLFVFGECGYVYMHSSGTLPENSQEVSFEERRQKEYEELFPARTAMRLKQLREQKGSILFSDPEQQLLLEKEIVRYEKLSENTAVIHNIDAITQILSFQTVWAGIVLVFGFILIRYLFIQDDNAPVRDLYASTVRDRKQRTAAKLSVLLTSVITLWVLKGCAELGTLYLCGISGNEPIQMLYGFFSLDLEADIFRYIRLMNTGAAAASVGILMTGILFYILTGQYAAALTAIFLILAGECIAGAFISAASPYAVLKYANLFTLLFDGKVPSGYRMVLNQVVSNACVIYMAAGVFGAALLTAICAIYGKQRKAVFFKSGKRPERYRRITSFHLRRVFIQKKGAVVLGVLFFACGINALRYDSVRAADSLRFEAFRRQYYGTLDTALLERIELDKKRIENAAERRNDYLGRLDELSEEERNELEQMLAEAEKQEYIEKVYTEVTELYQNGADVYQNNDGLKYIVRKDDDFSAVTDFIAVVFPAGVLCIFVMNTYRSSILSQLSDCSFAGRKKVLRNHAEIMAAVVMICILIVYGMQAWRAVHSYPFHLSGTVDQYLGIHVHMSVGLYLLIHYMMILIFAVFLVLAAVYISVRVSFTGAFAIWILTFAVGMMNPFIYGSVCYDYPLSLTAYGLFMGFLAAGSGILYYYL